MLTPPSSDNTNEVLKIQKKYQNRNQNINEISVYVQTIDSDAIELIGFRRDQRMDSSNR
jgi:hypothetical protein